MNDDPPGDSTEDIPHEPGWAWSSSQRRVLTALLAVLVVVFSFRYFQNRAYVPNPPPAHGPRHDEVADKINPNTADVATLSALPLIGEKRAQDIVDYRESHRTEPNQRVFNRPEDLLRIKGIGRAYVETIRPHLFFPSTAPGTTRPL